MHFSRLIANLAAFTGLAIAKPDIVIVPGAWQIEPSWTLFRGYLEKAGYNVSQVTLPSVGVSLTGLDTDVSATQAVIDPLLEEGKEVVVLCHSMGGLVAANSVESRDIASRSVGGLEGGVVQLIYLAAFITPAGYSLYNLMGNGYFDWMLVEDGKVSGNASEIVEVGFNDLDEVTASKYASYMTWTSEKAFTDSAKYSPWTSGNVTEAYIHTLLDNALPYPIQSSMAALLPEGSAVYSINSSHVPFISHPDELLTAVEAAVEVGVEAATKYTVGA
ncbi:hypothetical protein SLS64_007015 [Diaporthe eres]